MRIMAIARGDDALLRNVAELAVALAPSKERHLETTAQGRAFLDACRAAWPCASIDRLASVWDGAVAYPVAVAVTAAGHDIPLAPALNAYLGATAANLVSAGVRLIPLGQTRRTARHRGARAGGRGRRGARARHAARRSRDGRVPRRPRLDAA